MSAAAQIVTQAKANSTDKARPKTASLIVENLCNPDEMRWLIKSQAVLKRRNGKAAEISLNRDRLAERSSLSMAWTTLPTSGAVPSEKGRICCPFRARETRSAPEFSGLPHSAQCLSGENNPFPAFVEVPRYDRQRPLISYQPPAGGTLEHFIAEVLNAVQRGMRMWTPLIDDAEGWAVFDTQVAVLRVLEMEGKIEIVIEHTDKYHGIYRIDRIHVQAVQKEKWPVTR